MSVAGPSCRLSHLLISAGMVAEFFALLPLAFAVDFAPLTSIAVVALPSFRARSWIESNALASLRTRPYGS